MTQWWVAALHPPHLAAIVPWEGLNDVYRDILYHGGILSEFLKRWGPIQSTTVQYGVGERGARSRVTGEPVAGPETLSEEELEANRIDLWNEIKAHPLDDEFHNAASADLSKVEVPLLSSANWGGQGVHPRGNFNGFVESRSTQKWLEVHGGSHWTPFYCDWAVALQKRFLDYFLKGDDNGWDREPRVQLRIRYPGERFELRMENEWPLERTQWTEHYLSLSDLTLTTEPITESQALEYNAGGDGLTFLLPIANEELEITGPIAAKLFISADTEDTDIFLVLRLFEPSGEEVTFQGSTDPNTPIANGWLRASHRRLDQERTLPHRPYHSHDRVEPLTPGTIYELDVEIIPTCIVVPPGYRLALTVRGKDYEYGGELGERARTFHYATRGTGGMTHNDPEDRPIEIFAGRVTLHSGGPCPSHVLLPIIPTLMNDTNN
jgi:predicted acyl esterase